MLSIIKSHGKYDNQPRDITYSVWQTGLLKNQDPNSIRELVELDLGRHKVICLGKIDQHRCESHNTINFSYWVIESNQVVLTHPEHKMVKMDIPPHSILVLAAQDGRRVESPRGQFE